MTYLFVLLMASIGWAQDLTVLAGGGPETGSTALGSALQLTQAVAVDGIGRIYFSSQSRIFRIEGDGKLTRVAGSEKAGFGGDNGKGVEALLRTPYGLAIDLQGNLFISDYGNHRIRKVDLAGTITTVAGNGNPGFSGDGLAGPEAQLRNPCGLTFDKQGNLYIADSGNHRIRMLSPEGAISTVVGFESGGFLGDDAAAIDAKILFPTDVVLDSAGNLYIADYGNHRIRKVDTSGKITTFAGVGGVGSEGDGKKAVDAQLNGPIGLAIDRSNNLFIADHFNHKIRRITTNGTIATFAGSGTAGFSGDDGAAGSAKLYLPHGVVVDPSGNLILADLYNQRIRRISSSGTITTIAGNGNIQYGGDGDLATQAQLSQPGAAVLDSDRTLYIADTLNHRVRRVDGDGRIRNLLGDGVAGANGLSYPSALALDRSGNLYVADTGNNRIRRVGRDGAVTTVNVGRNLRAPAGLVTDSFGNLYISDTGNHSVLRMSLSGEVTVLIGEGAGLNAPHGLAVDRAGNLYVADLYNHRVVRRNTDGSLQVIVAAVEQGFPLGLALDEAENLFVTYYGRNELRRVNRAGEALTLVDGKDLYFPQGLSIGTQGELIIADSGNQRVVILAASRRSDGP